MLELQEFLISYLNNVLQRLYALNRGEFGVLLIFKVILDLLLGFFNYLFQLLDLYLLDLVVLLEVVYGQEFKLQISEAS